MSAWALAAYRFCYGCGDWDCVHLDALDAVLAAGVDADYARDAHSAGVTEAGVIIDAWEAGISVEYLGALSGASRLTVAEKGGEL